MGILNKFAPSPTVLEIEYQGETTAVAVVVPSYIRWQEIEAEVPLPAVPYTGPGKTRNTDDPDYLQAVMDVRSQRQSMLVAEALHTADNFDLDGVEKNDLPGRTLEERAEAVEQMDGGVINAIYAYMRRTLNPEAKRKELEQRAESFRADGSADHGDPGTAGHPHG